MSVPRMKPKPKVTKSILSFLASLFLSLITSAVTVWLLTRIFPAASPFINRFFDNLGLAQTDTAADLVRIVIGFLIGTLTSMAITALLNRVLQRRAA